SYTYYSCTGCHQKGKSVCKGRHIPMASLDDLVVANVKDRLLNPGRLANILEALIDRQSVKESAVQNRRLALEAELIQKNEKLKRLYTAIEDGIVELDQQLKERIQALKVERAIVQTSLDRIAVQAHARAAITPARLESFSRVMNEKLDCGDVQAK